MCAGRQHVAHGSLVNNVADPSIFVVVQSAQAYPAYVIAYRP